MEGKKSTNHPLRWIKCAVEEEFLGENRKEDKANRKEAQSRDRSKYKKTDLAKYEKGQKQELSEKLGQKKKLEGRVISIVPQGIIVDCEGERLTCILKGILKREKTQAKNLVAVGDFVLLDKTGQGEGIIVQVKERRSYLSRADNLSRRKEQLIAVNIDQVIIAASVVNPPLKIPLIDRYIIATHKGSMTPIIVINKIDLLQKSKIEEDDFFVMQEAELLEEALHAYAKAGIRVICLSAKTEEGMEELKEAMTAKSSVFSGPSGVGKSSLINAVTGLDLRVGEVVERTKKGSHTTTTACLLPLNFGGWCIDTPGIKSFGVWDLTQQEVQGYFPEIQDISKCCKFSNCTHTHEQQCAVIQAVEKGELSPLRFTSYLALISDIGEIHVRR